MNPALLPKHVVRKTVFTDGCWEWTGLRARNGYGRVRFCGRDFAAHRLVYELLVGPIPEGLVLDHLCRVRHCVNPAHLRPCTVWENTHAPGSLSIAALNAMKTHCAHGHPLSGENLYIERARRRCRQCRIVRNRVRRQRMKAGAQ